ncbi:hypothetical protein Tco_1198927 [Tanacetum coccineum]
MEMLSLLKGVEMMKMTMKNPSLDQIRGQKEGKLEKNLSLLVFQRTRRPSQPTRLKKSPSLKQGFTEDHPVEETSQLPDWFKKPAKPLTPNLDWNKTMPTNHGPLQPWISTVARKEDHLE